MRESSVQLIRAIGRNADAALTLPLLYSSVWTAARWLPYAISGRNLSEILELMDKKSRKTFWKSTPEDISRAIDFATACPIFMRGRRCLRQGLLGYKFLKASGFTPELIFSVDKASVDTNCLRAHCWVEVNGQAVVGQPLDGHQILYVYGAEATDANRKLNWDS